MNTYQPALSLPRVNGYSPWGHVVSVRKLAPGIMLVTTMSHGGIFLTRDRQQQLAERAPQFLNAVEGCAYAPKPTWWEEDCEAVLPLLAFWDELPQEMRRAAYYANMVRTANSVYGLNLSEAA